MLPNCSTSLATLCPRPALHTSGDLFEDLKRNGGQIKEKYAVRDIIVPFLNALQYLHSLVSAHAQLLQVPLWLWHLRGTHCSCGRHTHPSVQWQGCTWSRAFMEPHPPFVPKYYFQTQAMIR